MSDFITEASFKITTVLKMLMATTFSRNNGLFLIFNLTVLFVIENFIYFLWYTFSGHSLLASKQSCFHFF